MIQKKKDTKIAEGNFCDIQNVEKFKTHTKKIWTQKFAEQIFVSSAKFKI